MLESYFEAIQYFKKIINYQLEETSGLACTWDGLVLEGWKYCESIGVISVISFPT